jgi:hypothetical protein
MGQRQKRAAIALLPKQVCVLCQEVGAARTDSHLASVLSGGSNFMPLGISPEHWNHLANEGFSEANILHLARG